MSTEAVAGPADAVAVADAGEGANAAEQMAAATQALRARLPLLQGEAAAADPYSA